MSSLVQDYVSVVFGQNRESGRSPEELPTQFPEAGAMATVGRDLKRNNNYPGTISLHRGPGGNGECVRTGTFKRHFRAEALSGFRRSNKPMAWRTKFVWGFASECSLDDNYVYSKAHYR